MMPSRFITFMAEHKTTTPNAEKAEQKTVRESAMQIGMLCWAAMVTNPPPNRAIRILCMAKASKGGILV